MDCTKNRQNDISIMVMFLMTLHQIYRKWNCMRILTIGEWVAETNKVVASLVFFNFIFDNFSLFSQAKKPKQRR